MTIYLSFTRTIGLLIKGALTIEALDKGFMFFGCSQQHALWADKERDGCDEWLFHTDVPDEVRLKMKERFRQAIEKAEDEGRTSWRRTGSESVDRWDMLWQVSVQLGGEIDLDQLKPEEHFNYPRAAELLRKAGHTVVS